MFDQILGLDVTLRFYQSLLDSDAMIIPFEHDDLARLSTIRQKYPQFSFVDSCIMAMSERLHIEMICTFDRRDFSTFRPRHCDYLTLLPE